MSEANNNQDKETAYNSAEQIAISSKKTKYITVVFLVVVFLILLFIVSGFYINFFIKKHAEVINSDNVDTQIKEVSTKTIIMNAFNSGDYTKALNDVDLYLKENPNDPYVLAAKATILANKGSVEFSESDYAQQAIEVANKALSISPNLAEALYARGYAYEIQNQFDSAITDYNSALRLDPNNPTYLTQLGHVYDLKGDPEKAKEYYQEALSFDENFAKALINMGRYEMRYGDKEMAKEYFEKSLYYISSEVDKAGVYYSIGMIYAGEDKNDEAYGYMEKAVSIAPNYPQALIGRGWTGMLLMTQKDSNLEDLLKQGISFQIVFADVEKAVNINPNQTLGYVTLARMYLRLPNLAKKSIEYYDLALDVVDNDITIMSNDREKAKKDIEEEKNNAEKLIKEMVNNDELSFVDKFHDLFNKVFMIKTVDAAWYGNCYYNENNAAETDYCYDKTSFDNWIAYLNSKGHYTYYTGTYSAYCDNGSGILLVACGSSNGGSFLVRPATNLCVNQNSVSWVDKNAFDGTWNWNCNGSASQGGGSVSCSANKNVPAPLPYCTTSFSPSLIYAPGTTNLNINTTNAVKTRVVCTGVYSEDNTHYFGINGSWTKTISDSGSASCVVTVTNIDGVSTNCYNSLISLAVCTGTRGVGSYICPGSSTGLVSSASWHQTDKDDCSTAGKCAWYYECFGTKPSAPTVHVCPGDDAGLTSNLSWKKVSSCTYARKCEYTIEPLSVSIVSNPTSPIEIGSLTRFTATVTGGLPPYSNFSWSGAVSGSGTTVSYNQNYIEKRFGLVGYKTVSITVNDSSGDSANDTINVQIQDNRELQ